MIGYPDTDSVGDKNERKNVTGTVTSMEIIAETQCIVPAATTLEVINLKDFIT